MYCWNGIMRNVVCGNQKLELFVYRWLCAHATFDDFVQLM